MCIYIYTHICSHTYICTRTLVYSLFYLPICWYILVVCSFKYTHNYFQLFTAFHTQMEVSWVIGVPPVIIHFWLGFSIWTIHLLRASTILGSPHMVIWYSKEEYLTWLLWRIFFGLTTIGWPDARTFRLSKGNWAVERQALEPKDHWIELSEPENLAGSHLTASCGSLFLRCQLFFVGPHLENRIPWSGAARLTRGWLQRCAGCCHGQWMSLLSLVQGLIHKIIWGFP